MPGHGPPGWPQPGSEALSVPVPAVFSPSPLGQAWPVCHPTDVPSRGWLPAAISMSLVWKVRPLLCPWQVVCRAMRVFFQVWRDKAGVHSRAVGLGRCIYTLRSCWPGAWPGASGIGWHPIPLPGRLGGRGRGLRGERSQPGVGLWGGQCRLRCGGSGGWMPG